mgnify:CR=1 FL=1
MAEKFQNKYRIASARAQWWNYGWNGAYFITICTKNREHFFGEIKNGEMVLSNTGIIADLLWHEIPNHSPFVELGDFVVMPNHIHGILILNKPNRDMDDMVGTGRNIVGTGRNIVGTGHALSLQPPPPPQQQQQQPGQKRYQNIGKNTVSSIIGSYKSAVTKHANRLGFENGWQTRFYDHIIRNDAEYQRISDYIVNNPKNWGKDKFYTEK